MRHAISVFAATILVAAPLAGAVLPAGPAQVQTSDEAVDAVADATADPVDAAPGPSVPLSQHVQWHPPIRIHGNQGPEGIVLQTISTEDPTMEEPVYRPGSGVMVGNGSAENPYVISGWDLSPTTVEPIDGNVRSYGRDCNPTPITTGLPWAPYFRHAIEIVNTDAHVVITDNRITARNVADAPNPGPEVGSAQLIGVLLKNADNVRIEGNQIGDMDGDRLYRGICAQDSDNLEIVGNTVEHTVSDAIEVTNADNLLISDNEVREGGGSSDGIEVRDATDVRIERNVVEDFGRSGFHVDGSPDLIVDRNTVRRNGGIGIWVSQTDRAQLTDNVVTNHNEGIDVRSSEDVDAHGNNIEGNDPYGLDVFNSNVDATNNYWGCPNGPDDAACDDVEGTDNYSPWLSSSNSDAGA